MKKLLIAVLVLCGVFCFSGCGFSGSSLSDDYENNSRYRNEVNEMSQRTGESVEDIDREIQRAVDNAGWDW